MNSRLGSGEGLPFADLLERSLDSLQYLAESERIAHQEVVYSQLLLATLEDVESEEQFVERLGQLGERTDQQLEARHVVEALCGALPNWRLRSSASNRLSLGFSGLHRLFDLLQDPAKNRSPMEVLVSQAVDHLNRGLVFSMMTLLDLLDESSNWPQFDAAAVETELHRSGFTIQDEALKDLLQKPELGEELLRILGTFPNLSPSGLLEQIAGEPDGARRRLLFALLELHGDQGRAKCLASLEESLSQGDSAWKWQRSLVHFLRHLPTTSYSMSELRLLECCSELGRSPQLVREAVAALGATEVEESIPILVERIQGIRKGDVPHWNGAEGEKLCLEIAFALRQIGSETARGWLVSLSLVPDGRRMPLHLLEPLADCDLSENPEILRSLLETFSSLAPTKFLGITLPASIGTLRNRQGMVHLVKALAGTRSLEVEECCRKLAKEYSGAKLGLVAASTVKAVALLRSALQTSPEDVSERSRRFAFAHDGSSIVYGIAPEGLLTSFPLPEILQRLEANNATGQLTLVSQRDQPEATLCLSEGGVIAASFGLLKGADVLFDIIQTPSVGRYRFSETPSRGGSSLKLASVLVEAQRRSEQYQRMDALLPAAARPKTAENRPTPTEESDASFMRTLWQGVKSGQSIAEIEASATVDRYRVRRLLVHWLLEGSLRVGSYKPPSSPRA